MVAGSHEIHFVDGHTSLKRNSGFHLNLMYHLHPLQCPPPLQFLNIFKPVCVLFSPERVGDALQEGSCLLESAHASFHRPPPHSYCCHGKQTGQYVFISGAFL